MVKNTRGVIPQVLERPKSFLVSFFAMGMLTFVFLGSMDALPDPAKATAQVNEPAPAMIIETPELPVRIVAKSISLDAQVNNPESTNIAVLDQALLTGAVRYPTSAQLGVKGTVLIFGHSSYLPVVYNQAYKAFNSLQNLKRGDTVSVYSGGAEYRYSVVSVRLADAREDVIELPTTGKHLVLVTCDSFSKKTNRFVVTAEFVGTYSLASN